MGVIFRQSFKASIVSYIGVFIGAVNFMFLLPAVLNPSEVGLIRTVIDSCFLLSTYARMGVPSTATKFFPYFKDEKRHLGIFGMILTALAIGVVLVSIISFVFQDFILSKFISKSPEITYYFGHVLILMFLISWIHGAASYSSVLLRITVPKIVLDVVLRLGVTVPVALYYFELIQFDQIISILILFYAIGFLMLLVYIKLLGHLHFNFEFNKLEKGLVKSMKNYMSFMILGSSGAIIVSKIDTIMLASLKGLSDSGVYSIAFFMAVLVEMPKRALIKISSPIIAQHFRDNQIDKIKSVYKKSSTNLMLVGGISFLLIWLNIDNIFLLVPKSEIYSQGKYVVLFIAAAKFIDMTMGVNSEIISNSNFYKWSIFIMPFFALVVIVSNLLFIPNYGINGAAIASMISILMYNVIRAILVKIKLDILPFSKNTLTSFLILVACYLIGLIDIKVEHPIIDIIIKSTQIGIPFIILLIFIKPSEDLDNLVFKKLVKKIKTQ